MPNANQQLRRSTRNTRRPTTYAPSDAQALDEPAPPTKAALRERDNVLSRKNQRKSKRSKPKPKTEANPVVSDAPPVRAERAARRAQPSEHALAEPPQARPSLSSPEHLEALAEANDAPIKEMEAQRHAIEVNVRRCLDALRELNDHRLCMKRGLPGAGIGVRQSLGGAPPLPRDEGFLNAQHSFHSRQRAAVDPITRIALELDFDVVLRSLTDAQRRAGGYKSGEWAEFERGPAPGGEIPHVAYRTVGADEGAQAIFDSAWVYLGVLNNIARQGGSADQDEAFSALEWMTSALLSLPGKGARPSLEYDGLTEVDGRLDALDLDAVESVVEADVQPGAKGPTRVGREAIPEAEGPARMSEMDEFQKLVVKSLGDITEGLGRLEMRGKGCPTCA
jgi:hypothetical protein